MRPANSSRPASRASMSASASSLLPWNGCDVRQLFKTLSSGTCWWNRGGIRFVTNRIFNSLSERSGSEIRETKMGANAIAAVLVELATDDKQRELFKTNRRLFLDTWNSNPDHPKLSDDDVNALIDVEKDKANVMRVFSGSQHSDTRSIVIKIEVP